MKLTIEGKKEEIKDLLSSSKCENSKDIDIRDLKKSIIAYLNIIFNANGKNNSPEMVAAIAELLKEI